MHRNLAFIRDHWHQYERWIKQNRNDVIDIKKYLNGPFFPKGTAINYSDLLVKFPNPSTFDFVYVENAQGTVWLPGSIGGTYYSEGMYYWNGSEWTDDDSDVYEGLQNITNSLNSHTHVKADITDFSDADYATNVQGGLADTAIQPGDLAFVAISGDYDDLTNKPIVSLTSYRSSFENDKYVYSGFIRDSVIVIKRCKDNTIEIGQNLTDLETDWINRLNLTYI